MKAIAKAAGDYLSGSISTVTLRILLIAAMLALPLAGADVLRGVNNSLFAKRFEWAPRQATGNIVFVAIDKRSLDAVGTWPWPRSTYATLLDKLVASGARDIFQQAGGRSSCRGAGKVGRRRFLAGVPAAGGGVIV